MKLEVGMYVRLNCNYELGIGKIIREIDEDNFIKAKYKDDFECSVPMYMISKASHNIIDLIEVGDYVNGQLVYEYLEGSKIYLDGGEYGEILILEDGTPFRPIETIVTKEQFESMSYKVGD